MKRDMSTMRHDVESVHHVKEDIDDLRDCIDKLQEQNRRRKLRLLEQVSPIYHCLWMPVLFRINLNIFYFILLTLRICQSDAERFESPSPAICMITFGILPFYKCIVTDDLFNFYKTKESSIEQGEKRAK
jgi:hypothetical protein